MQRSVAMIERAVFLHEDDDVFGIEEGAAGFRIDRQSLANGTVKHAPKPDGAGKDCRVAQKIRVWSASLIPVEAFCPLEIIYLDQTYAAGEEWPTRFLGSLPEGLALYRQKQTAGREPLM